MIEPLELEGPCGQFGLLTAILLTEIVMPYKRVRIYPSTSMDKNVRVKTVNIRSGVLQKV
jgi:hypothetical protein